MTQIINLITNLIILLNAIICALITILKWTLLLCSGVGALTVWALKLPFRALRYLINYGKANPWFKRLVVCFVIIGLLIIPLRINKLRIDEAQARNYYQSRVEGLETELAQEKDKSAALEVMANTKVSDRGRHISDKAKSYMRGLICKYFDKNCAEALAIANCESGLSPFNFSVKPNRDGTEDHGAFQVNDKWHQKRFEQMYGIPFEIGIYDPELNVQYAKFLYEHSGWNAWTCKKVLGV